MRSNRHSFPSVSNKSENLSSPNTLSVPQPIRPPSTSVSLGSTSTSASKKNKFIARKSIFRRLQLKSLRKETGVAGSLEEKDLAEIKKIKKVKILRL